MKRINLKLFRIKNDFTQQQMADKLGISKSHYTALELGKVNPSVQLLDKFSKEFEYDDVWEIFKKEN